MASEDVAKAMEPTETTQQAPEKIEETAKKAKIDEEPKEPAKADDDAAAQSDATKRAAEEAEETAAKKAKMEKDNEDAPVYEDISEQKAGDDGEEVLELDVDIDSKDVAWLSADDGEYLKKLEQLAGATVELSTGMATVRPKDEKWLGGNVEWADQLVHVFCAYRIGKTIDVFPLSQFQAWDPPLSVVAVPRDVVNFVVGKNSARLRDISDQCDAVSLVVREQVDESPVDVPGVVVEIGSLVEAFNTKLGRWLEATIVNIGSRRVTVRWAQEDSVPQSLVLRSKLRPLSNEDSASQTNDNNKPSFEAGDLVEAYFVENSRWFEAKIIKATEKGFIVKWTYDDDVPESTVPEKDVRPLPGSEKAKEAKEETEAKEEKREAKEEKKSDGFAVGDLVEAFFAKNGRWFEAKIQDIAGSSLIVKWTYDDDIPTSKVPMKDVRALAGASAPAKEEKKSSSKYQVGDLVEAFFSKNARWFEAKIMDVNKRGCVVKWTYDDDIPTSNVPEKDIRPLPGKGGAAEAKEQKGASSGYSVGDLVEAFYKKNKRWFEAEILKTTRMGFMVRWTYDDAEPASEVSEKEMRPLPGSSKPQKEEKASSTFEAGDLVEAYFAKNGKWFEAKILEVTRRGVIVKWTYDDDVPESQLPLKDIRALPGASKPAKQPTPSASSAPYDVGDLVEAMYEKSKQWFEAKIVRITRKGAVVLWTYDETQPQTEVSENNIRPLPGKAPKKGQSSSTPSFEPPSSTPNFAVGDLVEAFFAKNNRWFEAKIEEINRKSAIVKWTYDDDVPASDVQLKDIKPLPGSSGSSKPASTSAKETKSTSTPSFAVGDLVDAKFAQPAKDFKVGDIIEAKFGKKGRLFEAKVTKVGKNLTVQWTYDETVPETEVPRSDVKDAPAAAAVADRWFEAKVLKIEEDGVTVKWTYDDDVPESVVPMHDVKARPVLETDALHIYGDLRGRLSVELQVLNLIENKVPGYVSSKPKESDTCEGIGVSVAKMVNSGEFKARLIGKSGSMRSRISRISGSALEYIGNFVYIVGTMQERNVTIEVLTLLQSSTNSELDTFPSTLEALSTQVHVPAAAYSAVKGPKRAHLNQLDDEACVLTFSLPAPEVEGQAKDEKAEMQLSEGMKVEARFLKMGWFEATVVELKKDDIVRIRWENDPDEISYMHRSDIRELGTEPDIPGETEPYVPKIIAIIGHTESRAIAEMRIQAAIERKCPGTFSGFSFAIDEDGSKTGYAIEKLTYSDEELGRCDEKRRQTAVVAAHCTMEKIGAHFYLAGKGVERGLAKNYLSWLFMETLTLPDCSSREDVETFDVPESARALVTENIAQVEARTETIVFVESQKEEADSKCTLFVFGGDSVKRATAVSKFKALQEKPVRRLDPSAEKKRDLAFVVSDDELERRKKRALRFA